MSFKAPAILAPVDKRIRLKVGDAVVADSGRAVMLILPGKHPAYYLPAADFAEGALAALSDAAIPFDGAAEGLEPLVDHVTVAWDAVRWFEEDEEVLRHPRNPYVRVDCLPTSRRVQVVLGGHHVADSGRAVFLFETGFITRQYMPIEDVKPGILRPSELRSYCPYKGEAHYYSVVLEGRVFENVVWFYPEPYDECRKIKGLVAFYNEKVDAVLIDGEPESRRFVPRI
jgi:uncharacterized protein (DUF427 family)